MLASWIEIVESQKLVLKKVSPLFFQNIYLKQFVQDMITYFYCIFQLKKFNFIHISHGISVGKKTGIVMKFYFRKSALFFHCVLFEWANPFHEYSWLNSHTWREDLWFDCSEVVRLLQEKEMGSVWENGFLKSMQFDKTYPKSAF